MSNEQLMALADRMAKHASRLPAEAAKMLHHYIVELRALATPSPQADKARGEVNGSMELRARDAYLSISPEGVNLGALRAALVAYTTPQPQGDGKQGWYCARCQSAVPPVEVTYQEAHTECGRIITNDAPQARPDGGAVAEVVDALGTGVLLPSWIGDGPAPNLPIGTKLYTHPAPADVARLVDAASAVKSALAFGACPADKQIDLAEALAPFTTDKRGMGGAA